MTPYPLTTVSTNCASGTAPRMSALSLMTVFGTPDTRKRRTSSGYSTAEIAAVVIRSLSTASCHPRRTARGQCGHVGVEKTCSARGSVSVATSSRDSSDSPESPAEASRTPSSSDSSS